MIRKIFSKSSEINSLINQNIFSIQSIRWRRKPRWLPTAPSKLFRVPERHVLPENEKAEWLRLNNNYRTQVNSLRRYLIHEVEDRQKKIEESATPADEEAEFQRCLKINNEWNQEISKTRSDRIEKENEKRREEILTNIEKKKIRQEMVMKMTEEKVKLEQIEAASYITRENIDKAIQDALANPVDYNFNIDLQGRMSNELPPAENAGKAENVLQ